MLARGVSLNNAILELHNTNNADLDTHSNTDEKITSSTINNDNDNNNNNNIDSNNLITSDENSEITKSRLINESKECDMEPQNV
jgi:hypothetical protein